MSLDRRREMLRSTVNSHAVRRGGHLQERRWSARTETGSVETEKQGSPHPRYFTVKTRFKAMLNRDNVGSYDSGPQHIQPGLVEGALKVVSKQAFIANGKH